MGHPNEMLITMGPSSGEIDRACVEWRSYIRAWLGLIDGEDERVKPPLLPCDLADYISEVEEKKKKQDKQIREEKERKEK